MSYIKILRYGMSVLMVLTFFSIFSLDSDLYASVNIYSDTTKASEDHHTQMGDMKEEMKEMHEKMMDLDMTGDPDYDFAQMMIVHHKGAIRLAEKEVSQGKEDSLIAIAKEIIEDQNAEIDSLQEFVDNNKPEESGTEEEKEMTGSGGHHLMQNMDKMMEKMEEIEMKEDLDHNFAAMMKHHHEQSIDMANNYISHAKDENLKSMAEKMVEKSKEQIERLESWRTTHD